MGAVELTGKRAIVTGASSGIGRATAAALAAAGARVAGGARRVERLETEIALELDVTDPASCDRFVAEAVERLGGLDILVNNAGLALGRAPFDESNEEDEATVLGVNVAGLVRMTRLCLPHFGDWGHIVNMGSVAGRQAYEGGASYVAAKFAERGFTYALREDLLGRPIRITTVDPGTDRDGVLPRPLQGRRGEGRGGLPRRRTPAAGGHRRVHRLRAHAAVARERRRDRRQGAQPVVGRTDPARRMSWRVVIVTRIPPVLAGFDAVVRAAGNEPVAFLIDAERRRPLRRPGRDRRPRDDGRGGARRAPARRRSTIAPLLASVEPDLVVCMGFPWKIPPDALAVPRLGWLNGHPSLLPRHRGPLPIAWAIREGDEEIGITFHLMDAELDTGPILAQRPYPDR